MIPAISLFAADGPTSQSPTEGGPGVLAAWISTDPAVTEARRLVLMGHWNEAEAVLAVPKPGDLAPSMLAVRQEMLDLIARFRWEYSLDAERLAARLREAIPDVTAGDIDRWRQMGGVQWREVDGKVAYFRREPANIVRFCEGARLRLRSPGEDQKRKARVENIGRILVEVARTGHTQVMPTTRRVRYVLTIPADAPGVKPGALVRAWLPFPQQYRQQTNPRLLSASPEGAMIAPVADDAFPMNGAPQRSIYFEQRVGETGKPIVFTTEFEYTTSAYCPRLDDAAARELPVDYTEGSREARLPHICFTPEVQKLAREITHGQTNPLVNAREIFRWVASHVAYAAEEEYGLIPSLTTKALATGRGDCGVKAMTFITLCRAAGIPARWQSGWVFEPNDTDMHDWAEFYVAPWGWLPADPSFGPQASDNPNIRDFYFGHQDSYRLIVNRDYGCPLHPPKQSPRSEPLDFQRGEVEVDGHNLYVNRWSYNIDVEIK